MELAIEFSNEYIDVMEYTCSSVGMKIHNWARGKMPEGAYQNGVVVNTNGVATALKEVMKENGIRTKKAVLSVNGAEHISKIIKIPKSAPKHVRGLLKNELQKKEILANGYSFDYTLAEDVTEEADGLSSYTVCMLPTELVRNYQTTLKRAGITLLRIEPVSNSMEKLAQMLCLKERDNLTILVGAENTRVNILMSGPKIRSVNRSIQIKEEGIEENVFIVSAVQKIESALSPQERVLDALIEDISKLIQFQSQNSKGKVVDQILLYGELAGDEAFIQKIQLRTGIDTKKCTLPEDKIKKQSSVKKELKGYNMIGLAGGKLLRIKKELSFINLPEESDYISIQDRIPTFIGLGCVFALSVFYAVVTAGNLKKENDINEMEARIVEIESTEQYQKNLEVQQKLMDLIQYNQDCGLCISTLEASARMESRVFSDVDALVIPSTVSSQLLMQPGQFYIQSYDYQNKTATFGCIAAYQDGPADFARIVTNAGLFEQVTYSGFNSYQDVDGNTWYSFQLECSGQR